MTKITSTLLTLFLSVMVFGQSSAFASSFLCSRIHEASVGDHSNYFGKQVVFSSEKLDSLLSEQMKELGIDSKAALLFYIKEMRGHDFKLLKNRITLASETIDTLAGDSHFNRLDERTRSLIYRDLTDALFTTAAPEGLSALLFGADHFYFPPLEKDSEATLFIRYAAELRTGQIDILDRQNISEFIGSYLSKVQASEKKLLRVDNQFALIHLTYRKGPARAEELTKYAMNLVNALHDYDLPLVLHVNDLPVSEAQYVSDQLAKVLSELTLIYHGTAPQERVALQMDRVLDNLDRYQQKLKAEIALYPKREEESLRLSAMWTRLIKEKTINNPLADPY